MSHARTSSTVHFSEMFMFILFKQKVLMEEK